MAGRSITWKTTASTAVVVCLAVVAAGGVPADAASGPPVTKPHGGAHGAANDSHWGDDDTEEGAKASKLSGTWVEKDDLGSLYTIADSSGARAAWSKGITGRGVTVAVIDTGIAPVAGLATAGKVVNGPDLSFDGQRAGTRYVDGYGHGTHMAGIIAGRDPGFDPRRPSDQSFDGVAPDAQLLNVKVGATDGGADVSQVIAALDWVVQHRSDNGMNVRVVNLAYGTESVQSWQVDPLARAVENAWEHGLVVVTAAGNDGLDAASLLMPAVDPHVLAVGAVDHVGTKSSSDDVVADFTNGGSATRRPDVLAPGKSVVSLRVPGSYIDVQHSEGLVTGDTSGRFFRGSGTSQATAVVSGEVALLLQARPGLSPDQVKSVLRSTAEPLSHNPEPAMGAGVTDVEAALKAGTPRSSAAVSPDSTGDGSLEASRGGEHVVDPSTGDVLRGEVDVLGSPWRGSDWSASSSRSAAWDAGSWNGNEWTGSGWVGDSWQATAWTGDSWSGVAWQAHPWSDAQWTARSWRDAAWQARSWREESWLARSWRSLQ
jgi:serine protease AprX